MSLLSRFLRAALALFLTLTLAVTVSEAATAASPATAPAGRAAASSPSAVGLQGDLVASHRAGRAAKVKKWNVRTIWYYKTLPAKWDWSLSTAVAKWNASGARIRLARTTVPRKAQLRIGYAKTGAAAGRSTVGSTKNAYVHLSSRYAGVDALNARNRVTVMNVLAHELGHVFGFQHTAAKCSLMAASVNVTACNILPAAQPGYYKCRTIDTALVRRFIAMYGGKAKFPASAWCLIDPLPPVLTGVTFTGGTSDPVTVHWTPPKSAPSGSTMVLKRWPAETCGTAPSNAATYHPAVSSGVWHDEVAADAEDACFQLQLLNRYGAGRPAQKRVLARWVLPVEAPVVGTPSYDADADSFSFTASVPDGTTLHAGWDSNDPTTCVTGLTDGTDSTFVDIVNGMGTMASPASLPQCVSFFAYDPESHRYSAPVDVTFALPPQEQPAAPEIDDTSWTPTINAFLAPAAYPAGTHLVYLMDNNAAVCPGTYTSGGQAVVLDQDRPGIIQFQTLHPDSCVSFYAIDDQTGKASDPTSVFVDAPAPDETLDVGDVTVGRNLYPTFMATVTGAEPGHTIAWTSVAGACPQTAPTNVVWNTGQPWGSPVPSGWEDVYPAISPGRGTNCAIFTAMDWYATQFGAHPQPGDRLGPVTMKEYVDNGPLAPTVGTPAWNGTSGKFDVVVTHDDTLHAIYDPAHPTVCPTVGQGGASAVTLSNGTSGGTYSVTPPTPDTCVAFYSNSSGHGNSLPTNVVLDEP